MFGFIRDWWQKQERIVYIRIRNNKIAFYHYPQGIHYTDDAVLAIKKKKNDFQVTAVGKAVYALKDDDRSVGHEPFNPFTYENPENFNLAEILIRTLLTSAPGVKQSLVSPRIIIHPDKTYISETEEEAYKELALSAGAREAVVYVGDKLKPEEFEQVLNGA